MMCPHAVPGVYVCTHPEHAARVRDLICRCKAAGRSLRELLPYVLRIYQQGGGMTGICLVNTL